MSRDMNSNEPYKRRHPSSTGNYRHTSANIGYGADRSPHGTTHGDLSAGASIGEEWNQRKSAATFAQHPTVFLGSHRPSEASSPAGSFAADQCSPRGALLRGLLNNVFVSGNQTVSVTRSVLTSSRVIKPSSDGPADESRDAKKMTSWMDQACLADQPTTYSGEPFLNISNCSSFADEVLQELNFQPNTEEFKLQKRDNAFMKSPPPSGSHVSTVGGRTLTPIDPRAVCAMPAVTQSSKTKVSYRVSLQLYGEKSNGDQTTGLQCLPLAANNSMSSKWKPRTVLPERCLVDTYLSRKQDLSSTADEALTGAEFSRRMTNSAGHTESDEEFISESFSDEVMQEMHKIWQKYTPPERTPSPEPKSDSGEVFSFKNPSSRYVPCFSDDESPMWSSPALNHKYTYVDTTELVRPYAEMSLRVDSPESSVWETEHDDAESVRRCFIDNSAFTGEETLLSLDFEQSSIHENCDVSDDLTRFYPHTLDSFDGSYVTSSLTLESTEEPDDVAPMKTMSSTGVRATDCQPYLIRQFSAPQLSVTDEIFQNHDISSSLAPCTSIDDEVTSSRTLFIGGGRAVPGFDPIHASASFKDPDTARPLEGQNPREATQYSPNLLTQTPLQPSLSATVIRQQSCYQPTVSELCASSGISEQAAPEDSAAPEVADVSMMSSLDNPAMPMSPGAAPDRQDYSSYLTGISYHSVDGLLGEDTPDTPQASVGASSVEYVVDFDQPLDLTIGSLSSVRWSSHREIQDGNGGFE